MNGTLYISVKARQNYNLAMAAYIQYENSRYINSQNHNTNALFLLLPGVHLRDTSSIHMGRLYLTSGCT